MTRSFFSCDWRKLSNQTAWVNKEKVQKRVSATCKTELGHILKVTTEKKKSFGLKHEANLKTLKKIIRATCELNKVYVKVSEF